MVQISCVVKIRLIFTGGMLADGYIQCIKWLNTCEDQKKENLVPNVWNTSRNHPSHSLHTSLI